MENGTIGVCLTEALNIINKDRKDSYGDPVESFKAVANLWSWYLGHDVRPEDVTMMMVLLKIAREKNKHGTDNVVDMAGYTGLYDYIMSNKTHVGVEDVRCRT